MWQCIAGHKDIHKNKKVIVVGTGPSADNLICTNTDILIGVNRAIILSNRYNYVFVDSVKTLHVIEKFIGRTKYICMPWWSCGQITQNDKLVQKIQNKILLYSLVYECPSIYNAKEYSLNDVLLHIYWGIMQPALHFCKVIGAKNIELYGFDGGDSKKTNATAILEVFGVNKKRLTRTKQDYTNTKNMIEIIGKHINIPIENKS